MTFSDQAALDAIARLMSANEWDSELMAKIAEIIQQSGRPIEEPNA